MCLENSSFNTFLLFKMLLNIQKKHFLCFLDAELLLQKSFLIFREFTVYCRDAATPIKEESDVKNGMFPLRLVTMVSAAYSSPPVETRLQQP